MELSKFGICL